MELDLLNTNLGLRPLYDEDYDEKKKLKLGEIYHATIRRVRNILFHRKFFALLNIGFENSKIVEHSIQAAKIDIKVVPMTFEAYRKYVIIKSGYANVYQMPKGIFVDAKSISFSNMSEDEFGQLYSRALDVIVEDVGADRELIEKKIIQFL